MGILDFFRRKKEELKSEKKDSEEQKLETSQEIEFEKLEEWIADKKRESKINETKIIKQIEASISQLIPELARENDQIKRIDLKNRKEEQRIKNIVLENLSNYSSYIGKLISDLEQMKKENLQETVENINKIFLEFKQKSSTSFEKATFLVGRELEEVKEEIKRFFCQLNEIVEENKKAFENPKLITAIEKKLEEIKKLEGLKSEISKEEKENEKNALRAKAEEKSLEEDIKKIKNSEEYSNWEKRRQESNLKKKEIEKDIFEVKNMIDWKNLSNIFHINEKKMVILKEYENHFSQILENGGEEKFIEILHEANIETGDIQRRIGKIKDRKKEIHEILSRKDELEELASKLISVRTEIKNLKEEQVKILKRVQKIDENVSEIIKEISQDKKKIHIHGEE